MREMKDSGIEWIGEIPFDWELTKIGSVYDERNTKVSDEDYPPLSVTKQGVVPQLETAAKTDNGDNRKLICKNDFVINSRSDRRGSCGISEYEGSCSLINTVLMPQRHMCNRYYGYVFKSDLFADEYYRWGHGIVDDLWSTKWSDMKNIYIPMPQLSEQEHRADYLDSKCSKIDEIIAKQEQIIEKLKEYKLSVITEAVTKGINPYVEMKNSGVNWIGAIPQDWQISKMKYLGRFINGFAFPSNVFSDSGIKVMKIANIQPMHIDWSESSYVQGYSLEQMDNYKVNRDDLVFALTRPIINGGIKVAIADFDEDVLLNQRNAMFKGGKSISVKWQYYLMQNKMFIQEFALYIDGTGQQPNISTNEISNIDIPLPSLEEQRIITDYLDKKMNEIDKRIQVYISITERLYEYKKSLIYEVVTGKKEV